ncbi:hypothetical protein JW979_11400 [bacterium]|nr:hypothetical protein [candidate division CSSED10-310 bacterium]
MDELYKTTVFFTLVLALALVIERALEVAKALYDLLDSRYDLHKYWTKRAKMMQKKANETLGTLEYVDPAAIGFILNKLDDRLVSNQRNSNNTVPVLSGDLVRAAAIKIISKCIGIVFGIIIAFIFQINLIAMLRDANATSLPAWSPQVVFQTALTGTIIGLGTGLVHKFIRAIEDKRDKKRTQNGGLNG